MKSPLSEIIDKNINISLSEYISNCLSENIDELINFSEFVNDDTSKRKRENRDKRINDILS